MRRSIRLFSDLLLVAFATVVAVTLRGNFDTVQEALVILLPYMLLCIACAYFVFLIGGLDRTPWRYSSVADHLQVIVLTALAISLALVLTFAANRLEGAARSLPVFQGALIISLLISARSVARFWFARQMRTNGTNGADHVNGREGEAVLVIGVNTLSELFLRSVQEFASQHVHVAGILAQDPTLKGRRIQQIPVLGTVKELRNILQSLEVHGVAIGRIVVATVKERLLPFELKALLEVEKSSEIVVQFLSERLGFDDVPQTPLVALRQEASRYGQETPALVANIIDADHVNSAAKSFRRLKRIIDGVGATFLMVALSPLVALVAFIVALDVGFPLIFWQQRPGLWARPFKLYKFRTMRAPHDKHSQRIPDDERSSAVGRILRRTRLDELPQLYNVLVGDMSFVGPRPLLPHDQPPDSAARLSVRPGITGWAQVNGGRIISPSDKWILDIWYVRNASFALDLKIVLSTLKMILFGDRINTEAVYRARIELDPTLKTLLRTELAPAV